MKSLGVRTPIFDVLSLDTRFECQFCLYFNYGPPVADSGLRTPDLFFIGDNPPQIPGSYRAIGPPAAFIRDLFELLSVR
jgi:hypothetical protein